MALTQADIANQMIQQLRVLDPSASAAIGTPERKIIDTVAQALADAQVDLTALAGALDLDSKFGANLDKFLALFGFVRQIATSSTGVVLFSRETPSSVDITIPIGAQVASSILTSDASADDSRTTFLTTATVTLPAGETVVAAPVRASTPGVNGNVAANTITVFVGSPTLGVTGVTNPAPTVNGKNQETDDELKIRFKNTVFRNVSGTEDQYLALAVSTAFTTKANVVGPISRYREYIQIPAGDDTTANGIVGEWTSALSTIPYSKYVYNTAPAFISNGASGSLALFFMQDLDFRVNVTGAAKNRGDAFRLSASGAGPNPLSATTANQPSVSFFNVLSSATDPNIQALRAGDIVLFEHSYMSSESRNDFAANITNCVDVFIDGGNDTPATAIIPRPSVGGPTFVAGAAQRLYFENYRRVGEAGHRPVLGNYFSPVYFQPLLDLPDFLEVNGLTYLKGVHYWPVEDVSNIGGTIRSRNGIEWSATVPGIDQDDPANGPYTGATIVANTAPSIEVANYVYDKNIIDLQTAFEGSKQVTTDVLAHRARKRYFKLDVTVMYAPGTSAPLVNQSVQEALRTFFAGQYFGTTIQLSDLLQVIHNVAGIDNVRWTRDVEPSRPRVTECTINGTPLSDAIVDRTIAGTASSREKQSVYFPIVPNTNPNNVFTVAVGAAATAPIAYGATASTINTALTLASVPVTCQSGTGIVGDPYIFQYNANGWKPSLLQVAASFPDSSIGLNQDFYLKDNELPTLPDSALATDTLAGLVIRARAQNTWTA